MRERSNEITRQIKALIPETQEFLSKLISIPSCSGDEEALAQFAATEFTHNGFEVELLPLDDSLKLNPFYNRVKDDLHYLGRNNLVVRYPGKMAGSGGLLLNTHMDVVPPAQHGLSGFKPEVTGKKIYGRGACDAKGQIATVYLMFRTLKALGLTPPEDLAFHLVVEEEIGGNGTLAMMQKQWNFKRAVVLEPTEMKILTAARGAVWFRLTFLGKGGHSGQVCQGGNPLLSAVEVMERLEKYHSDLLERSRFMPPFNVFINPMPLTFGTLHSGNWPASVPENAVLEGVMGFLPNKTSKEIGVEIRQVVAEGQAGEYSLDFIFQRDCSVTDRAAPLVSQMKAACISSGVDPQISAMTACCDAWFYTQEGMPALIFGAGSLEQAHSADEWIELEGIAKAAECLLRLALISENE